MAARRAQNEPKTILTEACQNHPLEMSESQAHAEGENNGAAK